MSPLESAVNYITDNYDLTDEQTDEVLDKTDICCSQEPCMDNTYAEIRAEVEKVTK